jgi:hypothetical protein
MSQIDRPIFIVGHARGGTTILSAVINWHSLVGPRPFENNACDFKEFIKKIFINDFHIKYSDTLEQKEIWFDYFPGKEVFTHMGRELIVEKSILTDPQKKELIKRLTKDFHEKRYLSKAPTNSFRVGIIRDFFPDAKILAIYRSGPEVVSSWGQRGYGFGKSVSWGEQHCRKLGYREGIKIFSRKWFETIQYLESQRQKLNFMAITYDDLIDYPSKTLEKIFQYLELPPEPYIYNFHLKDVRLAWKEKIPWLYHRYLIKQTSAGMLLYNRTRLTGN